MTPYSKEFTITTTDANEVVALDYPGRCTIKEIAVMDLSGGSADAKFYSRAFSRGPIEIDTVTSEDDQLTVVLKDFLPVRVGDAVLLSNTDYDGEHRVVEVVDSPSISPYALTPARVLVLDPKYAESSISLGDGKPTVTTIVPAAEEPLYCVASLTGTGVQKTAAAFEYINQDPPLKRNIGTNRRIYVRFTTGSTYRIIIRSAEGIGMGG